MKALTYQFNIGDYQGVILYDVAQTHSAEELVANPKVEELKQVAHEYAFKVNEIPVGYNNLLLRINNQNTLVDAGIPRPFGQLYLGLEELKIEPAEIDQIIITHSDKDHIGGILDEEGKISFPNARYILLEDSWRYWSTQKSRTELIQLNNWTEDKMQFAWETYSKIKDLILLVKPGEEFIPGLTLFPAPGHRYDHSVLKVTSSEDQLMHIADALAHPLFMENRYWYSTYDADPIKTVETKIQLLNMCASENILVFGAHFPFPGLGYVQQEHESWTWQPII